VYARNVKRLELENVRLRLEKEDARPVVIGEDVGMLGLDMFNFPGGSEMPLVLSGVRDVRLRDTAIKVVQAKCTELKLSGKSLLATVENGGEEGLARVELNVAGKTVTRWVWVKGNEKKDVVFADLGVGAGNHEVRCGEVRREVVVE
ncbi:MAG: hypothetical protein ACM359_14915, partial [Bacillota bacterium]